ncbi:PhlB family protein [Halobellus captivus]|uniref:hypothetical protein n=1 Tax=Halobellus captivus TaxID=2592614 RepID=UPI0011AB008B|nr:hypothetical protein [Halobellus captivus]
MNSKQADENSPRTDHLDEAALDAPVSTETADFVTCENCKRVWYYDRAVCPNCRGRSFERTPSEQGTVVARTTVHVTPDGVPQPLDLGLVS